MNNASEHSFGLRGRGRPRNSRARQWTARPQPRWVPPDKRQAAVSAESRAKNLKLLTEMAYDMNNDGGIYTDDEEDLISQKSVSVQSVKEESTYSSPSEDGSRYSFTAENIVETVVYSQRSTRVGSYGDGMSEPPSKSVSSERIATAKARMYTPKRDHHMFGIKENSDMEFVCARQHVFHVNRFILELFVHKRSDLLNGNITDWDGMKRICEILYYHRMLDEQFLKCTHDAAMRNFWNIGNSIMHLVKQLDIPVVKTYIDRAIGFHRCANFRNCHSCTEHRRLFASVHDLPETKKCFFDSAVSCDLDRDIDVMLRL